MRFSDMKPGDVCKVTNVTGEGMLRKRMLDLGITRGTTVRMVRKAPLGDPIEIELRGYRLTLRKTESSVVELEPVTEGC